MGRTRRNCPVFGCGSTNLVRLANHLDQIHGMNREERSKWLKWSKMELCVPRQNEENNVDENMEKTLGKLLKQQQEMETKFYAYLKEHNGNAALNKPQRVLKSFTKRQNGSLDGESKVDNSKKWLSY